MEIICDYLVLLWRNNGPTGSYILEEVVETADGYYFKKSGGAYFQISTTEFINAMALTKEKMKNSKIEYSRLKSN